MLPENTPSFQQLTLSYCHLDASLCEAPGCNNRPRTKTRRYCSRACYWRVRKVTMIRKGQTFACEACGGAFYRYDADIKKGAVRGSRMRFCSKACENGLKSSTNVELFCPGCKQSFTVWASRIKNAEHLGQAIYCSINCRDDANKGIRTAREVSCSACGKAFIRIPALIRERNFCSRACFATQVAGWSKQGRGNWGHRDDLGHFVRSSWEANVCRVLVALSVPYEYEPRTFRLPTGKAYRPDLLIAGMLWIEVKGQMTDSAAAKIAAFRSTYPEETLIVLGRDDYRALESVFGLTLPGWEHPWGNWGKRKHAALFNAA